MAKNIQIGICTFELKSTDGRVQILPDGVFRTDDGRPHGLPGYKLNAEVAANVIRRADARQRDTVIDYEHQTVSGGKAPAAGWFHDLEYQAGVGMFIADPRWTEVASNHIDAGEYRYVSPVFTFDPDTGEVLRILHVAITNDPALDGMQELELAAAARFEINPEEETEMNQVLIALLSLMGLEQNATEEQATAALKSLLEKAGATNDLNEQIASLKTQLQEKGETFDPTKHASLETVTELKQKVEELETAALTNEIDDLVSIALTDGRLLVSEESWARELGEKNIASLRNYLEVTPKKLQTKNNGKQSEAAVDENGNVVLTEDQKAICKNTGISEQAYIAQLKSKAESN